MMSNRTKPALIEIKANVNQKNEITLYKLLEQIESIGKQLFWSLLDFKGIGNLSINESIIKFSKEIANLSNGMIFTWEDLVKFSNEIDQVLWMTLIGDRKEENLKRLPIEELYLSNDLVISMLDGDLWILYSKNSRVVDILEKCFEDVKIYINPLKNYPYLDSL
jgi:hypothetical protein